ncbi:MAG: nucleotidyltransferase domain-containing protein [Candidatus Aminicenantes bacterium]|nr:MAG: nucleotidyltransferase domain-containing protein [Candidatus Aminicenantes bacterium]
MRGDIQKVLKELKEELQTIYGKRLKKVILYGSWVRNQATEDSDIDISFVLEGEVIPGKEIDRVISIINEINLRYGVLISIYPVSEEKFRVVNSPLLLNIREEGITI